ncbi:MAG: protein tyrosine phosphatase family protein [bacterium]|nr:protein tyrosine phosphatase family protein [bacterium]
MKRVTLSHIKNFVLAQDGLGTAGQPTADQFSDIRAAGYELVIYPGTPDSETALPNEGELVTRQGMCFVHIPVIWTEPKRSDFALFAAILDAHRESPVFVHCVVNMRASAFVFLYRVIHCQVDPLEAKQVMQIIWDPNPVWEQFIDEILQDHQVNYFDL